MMVKVVKLDEGSGGRPIVVKRMQKRTKFIIYAIIVSFCLLVLTLAITLSLKKMLKVVHRVKTECGYVEGRRVNVITDSGVSRTVSEFLNIPYAAPPIGNLRWRAPTKNGSCWNDNLKYNNKNTRCVQFSTDGKNRILGQEDCLILNIWSPIGTEKRHLPVLVWLHGGAMVFGHSKTKGYSPDGQFAASMGVVVVSINYRLGIFGFLSLKELWLNSTSEGGYGNYGIMDQILALRWIKENIKNFRGDPNDVTIFGESGGGTAVYSLLSASLGLAKGLFHKVIASSGVPNIHTTYVEANEIYRPFIKKTNCDKKNAQEVQSCLRSLDAHTVLRSSRVSNPWNLRDYEWTFPKNESRESIPPIQIIDPIVIRHSPSKLLPILQSLPPEKRIKMDILMGNMAQEPITILSPNLTSWAALKKYLEPRVNTFSNGSYPELLQLYTNRSNDKFTPATITPYYIYSLMTADVILSCATTQMAYDLSKYNSFRVYSYIVSQPIKPSIGIIYPPMHGMDTVALFGFTALNGIPSKKDLELKKNLRHVFKNFLSESKSFEEEHRNKTMEFWNSTVHTWSTPYHGRECNTLKNLGLLTHSWGNVGIWD